MWKSIISILTVLSLIAQVPSQAQNHTFTVYNQDGISIAETVGGPKYRSELFSYEHILTLQSDEREDSIISNPMQFFSDENGAFYIADWTENRIAVFDAEGVFSHSIGRRGGGPGEFTGWPNIRFVHDGLIGVYDFSLRRFSRFNTDGSLVDMVRLPEDLRNQILDFIPLANGDNLFASRSEGENPSYELVTIGRLGQSGTLDWERPMGQVQVSYSVDGDYDPYPNPMYLLYQFGAHPSTLIHHNLGFFYTSGWEPVIQVFDAAGRQTRIIRADIEASSVSRSERRAVRAFLEERIQRNRGPMKVHFTAELENLQFPSSKAFWSTMEIDEKGYLWLQMPTQEFFHLSDSWAGIGYRVFSPDGEYLGVTRRPRGFRTRVSGGKLLVIDLEEDTGASTLKVYQIHSLVEGNNYQH